MPHLSGKAWKFLSAALMASTIVFGGTAASFAQANLTFQASEQLTRVDLERLTHDHWLGYSLAKMVISPEWQAQMDRLRGRGGGTDYITPAIQAFLDSMKGKSEREQIGAVDDFVNQTVSFKAESSHLWQSPTETLAKKTGQSIDFVAVKAALLDDLGFTNDRLAVILGHATGDTGYHAVLGVKTANHWIILDNRPENIIASGEIELKRPLVPGGASIPNLQPELMMDHTGIYKMVKADIIWGQQYEKESPQQAYENAKAIAQAAAQPSYDEARRYESMQSSAGARATQLEGMRGGYYTNEFFRYDQLKQQKKQEGDTIYKNVLTREMRRYDPNYSYQEENQEEEESSPGGVLPLQPYPYGPHRGEPGYGPSGWGRGPPSNDPYSPSEHELFQEHGGWGTSGIPSSGAQPQPPPVQPQPPIIRPYQPSPGEQQQELREQQQRQNPPQQTQEQQKQQKQAIDVLLRQWESGADKLEEDIEIHQPSAQVAQQMQAQANELRTS